MTVEIIESPIRFHLHGVGGVVENERYGEVGQRLMNGMWQAVKGTKIPTTGCSSVSNSAARTRGRCPTRLSRWSSSWRDT